MLTTRALGRVVHPSLWHTPYPIRNVIIYSGHHKHPLFGPYRENIIKRIAMFEYMNHHFRSQKPWNITSVSGEHLVNTLRHEDSHDSLLVIPAGQSTHLDAVFTPHQLLFLKSWFHSGGRGYFTCGSSYWVSRQRRYSDLCLEQPTQRTTIEKTASLALFDGVAAGPLCLYPGMRYKVGFYSDAVQMCDGKKRCSVLLSGGGSFLPNPLSKQPLRVLLRYPHNELVRLGKTKEECHLWDKAAILVKTGKGAALLSMAHPYYSSQDIDTAAYERTFPESGTDWAKVHAQLTPTPERMAFAYTSMIRPLEEMCFIE